MIHNPVCDAVTEAVFSTLSAGVLTSSAVWSCESFFFQAEDGIRDLVRSRGLGDVYKRQVQVDVERADVEAAEVEVLGGREVGVSEQGRGGRLSLIHI